MLYFKCYVELHAQDFLVSESLHLKQTHLCFYIPSDFRDYNLYALQNTLQFEPW